MPEREIKIIQFARAPCFFLKEVVTDVIIASIGIAEVNIFQHIRKRLFREKIGRFLEAFNRGFNSDSSRKIG